jgi:succinate dehydrogenase / fumarate reductase membrane anchor subunit
MTSMKTNKFVSPLARAKGLGSASEGVHHWLAERISGALLIPFTLWVVWSVIMMRGASYDQFLAWFQNPLNAVGMLVFILVSCYHGAAGLQVVIEDYVASHAKKLLMIVGVKIVFGIAAVAAVFSILKIAL